MSKKHRLHINPNQKESLEAAHASANWPLLIRLCKRALRKNGSDLQAHRQLGFALHRNHDSEAGLAAFRQATVFWPEDAELLINHANVLLELARSADALPLLEKVIQLRPNHSVCWTKMAQACYHLGLNQKGFDASLHALEYAKDTNERVAALTQSAIHRRELGQVIEAVKDCEQAIHLVPTDPAGHTNRMLFMLADPSYSDLDILSGAKTYAEIFERPLQPNWPEFREVSKDPWRKLRIGFISPDFRHHAVMYFIEGLFSQLDRSQFEVWAFYLHPSEDLATYRIRCHADHFFQLNEKTAEEQFSCIQAEKIDILIDLAGHTGHNGLLTLARKPAPVQVSTIGYPGTTGLQAVDWWISDDITDPQDADQFYTERLYRLPTRWTCYRPMSRNPLWRYQPAYEVQDTPAIKNGHITFGSCNNLGKLTDEVLTLWGRLLANIPNAKLLIEGKNFNDDKTIHSYQDRCKNLGIDIDRLRLVNQNAKNQYLTYHQIDIALDPFPLVGGTTSNDLLWMGVPLITLNGDSLKSRMGVGSLAYLGRHEWIARTHAEYLSIATDLASDYQRLNNIRLGLRREMESSVLMREDVFALEFGKALRKMWMDWTLKLTHPEWTSEQISNQVDIWSSQAPENHQQQEFKVGISPEEKIPLTQAYERLQAMLEQAKNATDNPTTTQSRSLLNAHWLKATELAEHILCAKPNDPMALTVLAEIENEHGHTDFGRVYLKYALQALIEPESPTQLLERTKKYVHDSKIYLNNGSTPDKSQEY